MGWTSIGRLSCPIFSPQPPVPTGQPESPGTVPGRAPRTPPGCDSCRPCRRGPPRCSSPDAQRTLARSPIAGRKFHAPPLVPTAASASNSCGKRAKLEDRRLCLPGPMPMQLRIRFPSPAGCHPASLTSGPPDNRGATKGYKTPDQIGRCSGSLRDYPDLVESFGIPKKRDTESTPRHSPVQFRPHHGSAPPSLRPNVGNSSRSRSPISRTRRRSNG